MARERGAGLNSLSPRNIQVGPAGEAVAPLRDVRTGFRSGFVFELRDLLRPDRPVAVHSFALNPQQYMLTEPFQSVLTPTEDNTVVAEENGQIIREIVISGTFGLKEKRGPSFSGDQGSRSGNEHFIHLRELFRQYSRIKQNPELSARHVLIFHSMRDDDHFIVVPRSFETPRDSKSTRFHYPYRITMAVVAEAAVATNLLGLPNVVRALSAAFHDARAYFAEVSAVLGSIKGKVQDIESVLVQSAELINGVGEVLDGTRDLINYPLELAADVATDLAVAADRLANSTLQLTPGSIEEQASRQMRRLESALDRILAIPEKFGPSSIQDTLERYEGEQGLSEDDLANNSAGATIGSRTRLALGSGGESGIDASEYRGVLRERLDRTQTILGLSVEFGVPEELIILVNDLKYPYIAEGGGPGVLAPGDVILIPVRQGVQGGEVSPSNSYLTPEEALYGIDMALDPAIMAQQDELELRCAQSGMDVDLIRGIDNVVQGTEITVRTERGSTVYVPEVGIRRNVGNKGTIQYMLLAALALREGILGDPRVEGIHDSRVVLEDDVLTQEITPRLRGDRTGINFILPFGTASGEGG